jgi:hypothetical protein
MEAAGLVDTGSSLDGDMTTLHIRCGSDIRDALREGGFTGDFLEYSDPICQGPVPDTADLIDRRAQFVEQAFGRFKNLTAAQFRANLEAAERELMDAHAYERVVLWFEHDSYDQLLLARCLAHFADNRQPVKLSLICIGRHPSVERFIGLGQLGPSALASLWPARTVVTREQVELGLAVWAALRRPDPTALSMIAATGTPALPLAAPALHRHLRELPGVSDGLGLTERLVLRMLCDGPIRIGRMFAGLTQGLEPLPFLGDLGFLYVVEQMALTQPAVITVETAEEPFRRVASITEIGRRVVAGEADYLSLEPPERWVGGVRIAAGQPAWRFDEASSTVVNW